MDCWKNPSVLDEHAEQLPKFVETNAPERKIFVVEKEAMLNGVCSVNIIGLLVVDVHHCSYTPGNKMSVGVSCFVPNLYLHKKLCCLNV